MTDLTPREKAYFEEFEKVIARRQVQYVERVDYCCACTYWHDTRIKCGQRETTYFLGGCY